MKIPKEMTMLAGTGLGLMVFAVITALGYIFGGKLKNIDGMSTDGNTTVNAILAVFSTITGLLTIIVLWQVARIVMKGFGTKN